MESRLFGGTALLFLWGVRRYASRVSHFSHPTLVASLACVLAISACKNEKNAATTAVPVPVPVVPKPGAVESFELSERVRSSGETLFERLPASRTGLEFIHQWMPKDEYEADQIGNASAGGAVAIGDFDNDGRPDVFLTRPHGGARLYRNLGDFRFADATESVGIAGPLADHWSTGATFVDIDGDGYLDLYVCGFRSPNRRTNR